MAKYAWATDIHLDHIDDPAIVRFAEGLVVTNPTGVFLTGDISNAKQLVYHLSVVERVVQRPTYFVLGNHDYYGGEIDEVQKLMKDVTPSSQFLKYVPLVQYVPLSPTTALVGHDGWYDALLGDQNSRFMMSDWKFIKNFVPFSGGSSHISLYHDVKDRYGLIEYCRQLAHKGVMHVHNGIKAAARTHKNIIVMTHFPPFAESHIHEGKQGDASAMPWFTSKMMGDLLLQAADAYPNVNFNVLCGHTHGSYNGKIKPNLEVHVGGADYGHPALAGLIDVA